MPAADELRAAIRAAGGEIPFETFVAIALYGRDGFYTRAEPGRAGRRGDFITSPEVGPLFGAVLARALDDWWRRLGSPSPFVFVDAGAGPGTLARSVIAAEPQCLAALEIVAVETSGQQREFHPAGIVSTPKLPSRIEHGVIVANELLDNLPFGLWVHDGTWLEARVVENGDGFAEVLRPGPTPECLPSRAPHGARAPVQRAAAHWLESALASLGRGRVVVIDYCTPTTSQLAVSPWREWLRTYKGHERGGHYLIDAGGQDITVEVAVDQLAAVREPDATRTQAQFLQLHGIDELVAEGRGYWEAHAARPDLAAVRMRSRVSEADALLDPAGLGNFTVLEWRVE